MREIYTKLYIIMSRYLSVGYFVYAATLVARDVFWFLLDSTRLEFLLWSTIFTEGVFGRRVQLSVVTL